ncbi:MAG: hypothetical protein ABJM26_16785 [Anderseniella sp.]
MKKFLLAVTLATFAALVAMTGAKAAPVSTGNLSQSTVAQSTIEGLTSVHIKPFNHRHNCRRHGVCGGGFGFGPGGVYIGPGYYNYGGSYTRSCRRVRRSCRRRFDRRRRVRRCIRRNGC